MKKMFFIAGAAKSGSSSLYYYLGKHPDIYMSKKKEIGFFSNLFNEKDVEWYQSHFDFNYAAKIYGEATVEYMVHDNAPLRIKKIFPDAKIIFILRDPIERAVSHYWHRVKMGIEKRTLDEVIDSDMKDNYPVKYSLYYKYISRYFDVFDEKQVLILRTEDLYADFNVEMKKIFDFLGLDFCDIQNEGAKNKSMIYRSKITSDLLYYCKKNKGIVPVVFYKHLKGIYKKLFQVNMRPFVKPEITKAQRKTLSDSLYSDTILLKEFGVKNDDWVKKMI